jgi:hypothetical protein
VLRDYRAQDMAFEFVDMSLDERSKFRRMLADSFSGASAEVQSAAAMTDSADKTLKTL